MSNGFGSYWWRVIMRSAVDAKKVADDLGMGPIKLVGSFTLTMIACVVGFSFLGQTVAERILWGMGGFVAGLGGFLFIFTFFVVRTPWKFENENLQDSDRRIGEVKEQTANSITVSERLIHELQIELATLKSPTRADRINGFIKEKELFIKLITQVHNPIVAERVRTECGKYIQKIVDFCAAEFPYDTSELAELLLEFEDNVRTVPNLSIYIRSMMGRVQSVLDRWLKPT